MASTSSSSAATGSAAQHIDVNVEDETRTRGPVEALDEDMAGDATPAADDAQSPQSTHTTEPHDDSGPATPFHRNDSANRQQSGSRTADADAIATHDEDDDMMDPVLPGVEGRVSAADP